MLFHCLRRWPNINTTSGQRTHCARRKQYGRNCRFIVWYQVRRPIIWLCIPPTLLTGPVHSFAISTPWRTYNPAVLQPFRRIELIVHIAIFVLPSTYFHLSQVKHLRVKCLAQGLKIETLSQDWEGKNIIFLYPLRHVPVADMWTDLLHKCKCKTRGWRRATLKHIVRNRSHSNIMMNAAKFDELKEDELEEDVKTYWLK